MCIYIHIYLYICIYKTGGFEVLYTNKLSLHKKAQTLHLFQTLPQKSKLVGKKEGAIQDPCKTFTDNSFKNIPPSNSQTQSKTLQYGEHTIIMVLKNVNHRILELSRLVETFKILKFNHQYSTNS